MYVCINILRDDCKNLAQSSCGVRQILKPCRVSSQGLKSQVSKPKVSTTGGNANVNADRLVSWDN